MTSKLASDMPDDYPWLPGSDRYPLADLGELAARLGSVDVYERRGEVILIDDFSYGLSRWSYGGSGTGTSVKVQALNSNLGPYCIRLTGGKDTGLNAYMQRSMGAFSFGSIGVECSVSFPTLFDKLEFNCNFRSGLVAKVGCARISRPDNALYIQTIDDEWIKIATLYGLVNTLYSYHTLKFLVDFSLNHYIRIMFDYKIYDISQYDLYSQPIPSEHATWSTLTFYSRSTFNDVCTIGHVIFTANEQ